MQHYSKIISLKQYFCETEISDRKNLHIKSLIWFGLV